MATRKDTTVEEPAQNEVGVGQYLDLRIAAIRAEIIRLQSAEAELLRLKELLKG